MQHPFSFLMARPRFRLKTYASREWYPVHDHEKNHKSVTFQIFQFIVPIRHTFTELPFCLKILFSKALESQRIAYSDATSSINFTFFSKKMALMSYSQQQTETYILYKGENTIRYAIMSQTQPRLLH